MPLKALLLSVMAVTAIFWTPVPFLYKHAALPILVLSYRYFNYNCCACLGLLLRAVSLLSPSLTPKLVQLQSKFTTINTTFIAASLLVLGLRTYY